MNKKRFWTEEEIEQLKEMYERKTSAKEMAHELGRTTESVKGKLGQLKVLKVLPPPDKWSEIEDNVVRAMTEDGRSNYAIGKVLGRSTSAVGTRKTKLGIKLNEYHNNKRWSKKEESIIWKRWNDGVEISQIAKEFERTNHSIRERIKKIEAEVEIGMDYKPPIEKPKETIHEIRSKSKEQGLTYGQYVAQKYLEEEKR